MIRTIVTPSNTDLHVLIPKEYVRKQIEVLLYTTDEIQEEKINKKNSVNLRGKLNLSDEQYLGFQKHTKDLPNEWNMGYLIDTNSVIDYLDNKLPDNCNKLIDNIEIQTSVIVRMELLLWHEATKQQTQILEEFIGNVIVFGLEENIILKAIDIRKNFRLKLPNAIIAATALIKQLSLITRNISDFKNIPKLRVIDPWSL